MKMQEAGYATKKNTGKTGTTGSIDSIIIADGTCSQIRELLLEATAPVHWLSGVGNALAEISELLHQYPCRNLDLVGHGQAGALHIADEWINSQHLVEQSEYLADWQLESIAIWSCEVGKDPDFASTLAQLTSAKVFTSSKPISREHATIWEQNSGEARNIQTITTPDTLQQWPYSLGTVAFTPANIYLLSNVSTSKVTPSALVNGAVVSQADPVQGETTANNLFTKTSGNNLLVAININGTTVTGDIQRRVTSGNNLQGLVFFQDVNNDGSVPEGGEGGTAYLIANSGVTFQLGIEQGTNSANPDQLVQDLNALLSSDGGNQASSLPPEASITNISVSEASPFAVVEFSLSRPSTTPVSFTPQLVNGTGTAGGVDAGSASGSGLEFFDNGTSSWLPITSGVTLAPGTTSVLLRTPVINDATPEGSETVLIQTGTISGSILNPNGLSSTITIVDDGTQTNTFLAGNNTATPTTGTADNDFGSTPLVSVSSITVSESSQQAVVRVSLSSAATGAVSFTPSFVNGTATAGADTGAGIEFFNGTAWASAAGGVTIPTGGTSVLLRTAIVNDTIFENSESLQIQTGPVSPSGSVFNAAGASGTITILDNGTATNSFDTTNTTAIPSSTNATNNDIPTISVGSVSVSESSPFAVVKASLSNPSSETIQFIPSLTSGSATIGTDTSSTIEFFNGSSWVSAAAGATIPPFSTDLLLRVAINNDTTLESLSAGLETFTIGTGNILTGTVSNPSGASGSIAIIDNGTQTNTFLANNNTFTPTVGTADNDAPALTVGSITVSESSPFAVVPISLSNPSNGSISFSLTLSPSGSTLNQATIGTDTGSNLEFFDGTNWQTVSNSSVGNNGFTTSSLTIAAGQTQLLVRLPVVNDLSFEGLESLHLSASQVNGASVGTSTGTLTIADDGTSSNIFLANNNTATPSSAAAVLAANITALDNDLFCPPPSADINLNLSASGQLGAAATLIQPVTSNIVTGGQAQATSLSSTLVSLLNAQVSVGNSLTTSANESGNLSASATAVTAPTVSPFTAEPTFDGKIYTRTDSTGLALNNGDRLVIAGEVRYVVNATPTTPTPGSSSNIGDTFQLASAPVGQPLFDSAAPQPGNNTFTNATRNGVNSFAGCACETGGLIDTNNANDIDLSVGTNSSINVNVLNVLQAASLGVTADTSSTSNSSNSSFFGLSNTGVQTGNNGSLLVDLVTSSTANATTTTGQSAAIANNANSIGIRDIGTANSIFLFGGSGTLTTLLAGTAQATISNIASSEGGNADLTFQLSQAYPKTVIFTPSLANGTGSASSDVGATIQASFDGNTWFNASGGVSLEPGVTSVQLRTSIINDGAAETSETVLLKSGPLTDSSGNILSNTGATGVITIVDSGQALPTAITTGSATATLPLVPVTTEATASTITGNSSASSNQGSIAGILDRTSGEAGIGSTAVANQLQFGNQAVLTSNVLNNNRATANSITGVSNATATNSSGVFGIALDRIQVGEGATLSSGVNTTTASASNSVTGNTTSTNQAGSLQALVLDELSIGASTSTNTPSSVLLSSIANLSATAGTVTGVANAISSPTKVTALSLGEGLAINNTVLSFGNGGTLTGNSQLTQSVTASAVTGAATGTVTTPAVKGLELFAAGLLGNGGSVAGQATLDQTSNAQLVTGAATSTNTAVIVGTESPALNFGSGSGNTLQGDATGTLSSNSNTVTGPATATLQASALGINGVGNNASLSINGAVNAVASL